MGIAQKERDFETFKYSRSLVNTRLYLNSVKIEYESKKVIDYFNKIKPILPVTMH